MVLEPAVLVETPREIADDRPVLGGEKDDVELAVTTVPRHGGNQLARGRRLCGIHVCVSRLLRVRRKIATVVRRPLLVAERLEAILQVLLELLIELLRLQPQGFLVRIVTAADDALAEREEELAKAFLPPARLDELEHGVPEVVDHPRAAGIAVAFEVGHLRHDVRDGGIPHHHQVDGAPVAGHVIGQALVHPQRHAAADERLRDDVELEDVRQLMNDEPVEQVGRLVDRQHHAVAGRLGKGADALLRRTGDDVLLLELAARLEDDERNLEGEVVLQVRADLLVCALGVAGHPLEVLLDLGVVVDLEVVRRVDVPPEIVVPDLVLAVIRHVRRLAACIGGHARHESGREHDGQQARELAARDARAHRCLLAG